MTMTATPPARLKTALGQGRLLQAIVLGMLALLIVLPLGRTLFVTLSPAGIEAWGDVTSGRLAPNLFSPPPSPR